MQSMFVLIGLQGSGKSTWAKENAARLGAVVIASDEIRNELEAAGFDAMGESDHVFAILEDRVNVALTQGRSVIVDATHVRRKWRENVLALARRHGARRVAVWFDVPLGFARMGNLRKPGGGWGNRPVPEDLLKNMANDFEPPAAGEFDEVMRLTTKELGG